MPRPPAALGRALDTAMDRTILPGYSRIGYDLRRPSWAADDPRPRALEGRVAVVTGTTSGLGTAIARGLGQLGAHVVTVVRDEVRGRATADQLARETGAAYDVVRCDLSDLDDVRRASAALRERLEGIDILVHNAGAMPEKRTETPQGHETTVAVHVLAPVLMTEELLPRLRGRDARVIVMSSGGMYAQRLPVADPEYRDGAYKKASAYARSKRMQVAITPLLQERWAQDGVAVHTMHPGWADTPGVADSLPIFRALTRPILRTAEAGADTAVWLAATEPAPPGGLFWQDRRPRPTHYRRRTLETPADRERFWQWVRTQTELDEHPEVVTA